MGKTCITGCESIDVDEATNRFMAGGRVLQEGDYITLNGATGEVILGKVPLIAPRMTGSFGVLLYEMLTGELPFKAEHEAALLYLVTSEDPPVPSELDRRIPQAVDACVMRLLKKNRNDRPSTIDQVIADITRLRTEIDGVATASRKKAIAVLPFNNISPDKDSDYFADGLTEELIANLSRLKEMRVLSRTTSMGYRGTSKDIKTIGRELGTRYILEGSVRKFQDNLRITAQLIDVENDEQLWAETYKGRLADVFDIQEQVSKQIVDALMLKLSPTEKVVLTKRSTMNAEAFDCCLRGRNFLYRLTKNNVHLAIQLFQRAIELDPRYASAYAGIGEAYATMYQYFEADEIWLDRAIESSLKALMYDPSLSEAYSALGLAYFDKKSIDEAITATRKAIELDPDNFTAYWILGRIYFATDKESEAIALFKKTLELNQNFYSARNDLLMAYERLGDHDHHAKTLDDLLNFYPTYLSQNPDDARGHMYHAIHLAQVSRPEEAKVEGARALQLNPGDSLMMYNAACLYARLGDVKLAVSTLRDAIAAGQQDYEWIKRDTDLESIRNDPGYLELMKGR
jgi:TolB-like protein/Flp pilus assembly protein TadD